MIRIPNRLEIELLRPVEVADLERDVTQSLYVHDWPVCSVGATQRATARTWSLSSLLMGGPIGLRSCAEPIRASSSIAGKAG
jgi:hypothetical protein